MDWSKVVREAMAVAGRTSQITYEELNALIPQQDYSSRDIEDLLDTLQENGIILVEARPPQG
jgi:hypothetical protein